MKIAVTGGSGQLGSLILRRLLDEGKVTEVVSLDLRPPLLVDGKLRAVHADVRDPGIGRHLEGCQALFHLAFLVTNLAPRPLFDSVNVEGSKNVFRAAAAAGVKHLLYASSVAAYGVLPGHPVPLTEDSPRRHQPDFAYSANKWEVEAFLDGFEKEHPELLVTRMRPTIVIGTRIEHPHGKQLSRGLVLEVGGTPLPMVWDEDVADGFLLAWRQGASGAFNLTGEPPVGAEEAARAAGFRLVRLPRSLLLATASLLPLLARLRLADAVDPAWVKHTNITLSPTSERARTQLGWSPRCPRSVDVIRHYAQNSGPVDRKIAAFLRLAGLYLRFQKLPPELQGVRADVHLYLTGKGGGDWTLHVGDGRMSLRSGPPRPPASVVTLQAQLFRELIAGKTGFSSAQAAGRVRVEGEPIGGRAVGHLSSTLRTQAQSGGAQGAIARRLAAWMA